MTTTAPIIEQQPADVRRLNAQLAITWTEYRQADDSRTAKGLEFGRVCYELRECTKAQGSRTGAGFEAALDRLNISKPTAYRWIARYEHSAGLRITRDEVAWSHLLPDFSGDAWIIGHHNERPMVFIEPSARASGYFFVSVVDNASEMVEGTTKPIHKDAVALTVDMLLARVPGHFAGALMQWDTGACGLKHEYNRWLYPEQEQSQA